MVRPALVLFAIAAGSLAIAGSDRLWWSGPRVTLLGGPSRDGAALSYADPVTGSLAILDLKTGASRPIASKPAGSQEFAYFSAFSRDGRSVAYAWHNGRGFYELRVAAASGSDPVIAYGNEQAGFVQPCAWTPDGSHILTLLFRKDNISQIALIPASGGAPRVLRSLNWVYPKRMDLSPDGAWVVYDNFAAEGAPERTIFILSTDGAQERRLIDRPGNFLFPLWSADGRRVYFAAETGGAPELWSVQVENGKPQGAPSRAAGNLGRFLPMGITNSGDFFYGVRTGSLDLFRLPLDGSRALRTLPSGFPGRNQAPAWSSDGKRVAYLSRRETENFGEDARAIVVQDLASGTEREVPARMAHIERLVWSPDARSLLAAGSDGKGRSGLFLVRVEDGATTPLAAGHGGPFRGFEAVWARRTETVYYLHGETELRAHPPGGGPETTILRAEGMRSLALNPPGDTLAVGIGGNAIRLTPIVPAGTARLIPFAGLRALAWGTELLAVRGDELWSVPADGVRAPSLIGRVPDLLPVLAVRPDGAEIILAAGKEQSEVRSLRLP